MSIYYRSCKKTTANSTEFFVDDATEQAFPKDGFAFGTLSGNSVELPALVSFDNVKGLCFLYNDRNSKREVSNCLERLVWRIAVSVPANLCRFLIFNGGDPGEDMNTLPLLNEKLFDCGEKGVFFVGNEKTFNSKIDKLIGEVMERMSIINLQGCSTLAELNTSLGNHAEIPYKFLILADFPHDMSVDTMEKISRLVRVGSSAGVYTIMTWDTTVGFDDKHTSERFDPSDLLTNLLMLYPSARHFKYRNSGNDDIFNSYELTLDSDAIDGNDLNSWRKYIDDRVDVAFAPKKLETISEDFYALEAKDYDISPDEICVTVGHDMTNGKPVRVQFNAQGYIHAFILGQAGSGKSELLKDIITAATLKYAPEDLVLYIMDFKGTDFSIYRGLKHTRAVLVENKDPQMTLAVLRDLEREYDKRVTLFRKSGVDNNIDAYNHKNPKNRLPHILFVADECQDLFKNQTQNSYLMSIQREIARILATIASKGRSQGIHLLLATQQIGEVDIPEAVQKNISEYFLFNCDPADSERLVPDSSERTLIQPIGIACYYHRKKFCGQLQTFYSSTEVHTEAISMAQCKASQSIDNGSKYFSGTSIFQLDTNELNELKQTIESCPLSFIGRELSLSDKPVDVQLHNDYSENILFFGANQKEQTISVLMNAMLSLMYSYKILDTKCDFWVIDCSTNTRDNYKPLLKELSKRGLCHIIDRKKSCELLYDLVSDIMNGCARPTILTIIYHERWIEMYKDFPLKQRGPEQKSSIQPLSLVDNLGLNDINLGARLSPDDMTYQQALNFILAEGPLQGVHVVLQVDKPANILFKGEYDVNATDKFRHKIMLRSQNKYLIPMRFSHDIDVEILGDTQDNLRAYYYPEDEDPILFTPYILPNLDLLINEI